MGFEHRLVQHRKPYWRLSWGGDREEVLKSGIGTAFAGDNGWIYPSRILMFSHIRGLASLHQPVEFSWSISKRIQAGDVRAAAKGVVLLLLWFLVIPTVLAIGVFAIFGVDLSEMAALMQTYAIATAVVVGGYLISWGADFALGTRVRVTHRVLEVSKATGRIPYQWRFTAAREIVRYPDGTDKLLFMYRPRLGSPVRVSVQIGREIDLTKLENFLSTLSSVAT